MSELFHESPFTPKELAQQQLEVFASNSGLTELASLFGECDLPAGIPDRLTRLQAVAAQYWDFRKGVERQATVWNSELLDEEGSLQWNLVFHAADQLGLLESTKPTNLHPNSLVILGGANFAPINRLRYALEVVDSFDQVVYLGSSRPIPSGSPERTKVASYVKDAGNVDAVLTEADLGSAAFEILLGATKTDEATIRRDGDTWGMRLYEFKRNGETKVGFVLSTPQTIGSSKARATTYDNYQFFARQAELSKDPRHTVVAVTTGFYSAGQHLPAVQELTLPYGVRVETVGPNAAYCGVTRKPAELLQETKAAVDAAVRLEEAIAAS